MCTWFVYTKILTAKHFLELNMYVPTEPTLNQPSTTIYHHRLQDHCKTPDQTLQLVDDPHLLYVLAKFALK